MHDRPDPSRIARIVAIIASCVAGAAYLLIGFGVLFVGESTQEGTNDLSSFGAMMAALSVVGAVVVWRFHGRLAWATVAVFQVIPLVGYVAFAGLREPPFELWGLLIKVAQAVVLAAMAYLLVRGGEHAPARNPGLPKGHAA